MSSTPRITPPSTPSHVTLRDLLNLVREDRAANLREWSNPGFQALLAYRLATYHQGLPSRPSKRLLGRVCRALQERAARRYGIHISHSAVIGRRVRLIHQSAITIHPRTIVGDGCWLRQGATLGSVATPSAGAPVLGRDVRLGANVVVEAHCSIGDGARIGPNCVVVDDVPERSSVMPVRSKSTRNS